MDPNETIPESPGEYSPHSWRIHGCGEKSHRTDRKRGGVRGWGE